MNDEIAGPALVALRYLDPPAITGAIIGALFWEGLRQTYSTVRKRYGAHAQLLNFRHASDVTFVYPRKSSHGPLPQIAWEDARAVDYFQRALHTVDGQRIHMRDAKHVLPSDRVGNLVIIGSPKGNPLCGEVLGRLGGCVHSHFCGSRNGGKRDQSAPRGICYGAFTGESPSFFEQRHALRAGTGRQALREQHDYALLVKAQNPFNHHAKVFIIAGIRAFGTWGAAKFLFHEARQLHDLFGSSDFEAIVKVTYDIESLRISAVSVTPHRRKLPRTASRDVPMSDDTIEIAERLRPRAVNDDGARAGVPAVADPKPSAKDCCGLAPRRDEGS